LAVVVARQNIVKIIRNQRVVVVLVVVLLVLDLMVMVVYTVQVRRVRVTTVGLRVVTGTWVAVVVPVQ
tara:strand:+ start:117 stop:320 length:204 start_codon:yes stop_codon:yes gene_type:complete